MPLPSLQYYDDLYNKRKANKPVAQIDGLDREIARMRSNEIKENLFLSASPDTVARVNRIARETGELPLLVEDRINDYEKSLVNSKFMQVADDNPGIAKWAVNNPRAAAAAADDWESLSMVGKAWRAVENIGSSLKVGLYRAGAMAQDTLDAAQEVTDTVLYPLDAAIATIGNNYGLNLNPDRDMRNRRQAVQERRAGNEAYVEANRPQVDGWFSRNLLAGVESVPATAAAVLTRNASAGSTLLGGLVGGAEYQAARDKGLNPFRAAVYGASQGAVEKLTEMVPVSRLMSDIAAKSPVGKTLINQLVAEIPGEQAATFLQDLNEWATLNPDKTLAEFVAERPSAAAETLVQTIGGVGTTVALTKAVERTVDATVKVGERVAESRRAKKEGAFLDDLAKATEGSKLKERDTEAFREMIRSLADENDIKAVYISGEALQEYMQSESFDAEGPLSRWTAEVEEAAALGGDVVMPIEEAMAVLPGTPAWQALRDDMRLSPGGISRKEAQTFDEAMADVMDELARTMAEQEKATAKKLEPIEKLSQSIAQKLQNVGFTPSAADTQARLLVQRYATRAERLGRELTGDEFGVTINQVLPEGIAQARAADNLDLVINSYFTMKKPKEQTGKSLVEWIASRGGITDEGGDLAAMGLGDWHKQKAFRKKVIRQSDKNQGNMLGAVSNDYSPNRILEAAIDEGYFPELQGTEEALDLNALLTAIEEELQGKPRYAQERIVDDVQQLAVQLDEFLSQSGFDPANMTREEMRAAIMQAQDAQEGGYEQLPDTIEIDGVERPTRNSNGQPLAQTEEGVRNFWNWFGDSKVVDAQGRPLVVYHGTAGKIDAFNGMTWGAQDKALAREYAAMRSDMRKQDAEVMPIYMKAQRIFDADALPKTVRIGPFFNEALEQAQANGQQIDVERAKSLLETIRAARIREESGPDYSRHDFWNETVSLFGRDGAAAIKEMFELLGFDGVQMRESATYGKPGEPTFGAFSPEQIKSVNNRGTFDPADARILFQQDEQGNPLVVVHNLSADKFRNADELGGLAAPSIAVIRADIEWNNFGDITLIGSPDLVDPKDKSAKGFNADVYSPRQPRAQFDLHGPTFKKLQADMQDAARDLGESLDTEFEPSKLSREGLAAIEGSPVAKLAYLRSIGESVRLVYSEKPNVDKRLVKAAKGARNAWDLRNDPKFVDALRKVVDEEIAEAGKRSTDVAERMRLRWFEEDGELNYRLVEDRARLAILVNGPPSVDRWETRKAIDKKIEASAKKAAAYRLWVQENYAGLIAGRFFEARDSGRRKDYTMENLVREMTRTIRDGEGYNYGVGSLRSNVAKQFRSIKEMQDARDSIISEKEMDAIKTEVSDEMMALGEKFAPYHGSGKDFGWMDIFTMFLKDLSYGRTREWQQEIFNEPVPDSLIAEAREFLGKLRDLPTEYFEVKMQRAVDFSEFAAAVVPDDTSKDVIDRLKEYGLKVEKYPKGGSRVGAIQRVAGLSDKRILFQQGAEYPLAPRSEWYGEGTYKADGGRMVYVSPQDYLAAVKPLQMDAESRENIDDLKAHIQSGKTLDPLLIRANGKEDGRHRAHAALELGITRVPVIAYGDQFANAPAVPENRVLFQSAYHGSPHIFDKFSLDAIGSGEGAQAFGWGLYFAGRKEIAEHYRQTLSRAKDVYTVRGRPVVTLSDWFDVESEIEKTDPLAARLFSEINKWTGDKENRFRQMRDWYRGRADMEAAIDRLESIVEVQPEKGRLYQVDIPEDNEYLLWDAPLSEQPERVQAALLEAFPALRVHASAQNAEVDALFAELTGLKDPKQSEAILPIEAGETFYNRLARQMGSDRAASEALRKAGIAGIKYLDGGSRSSGDGSYNYVVFDDSRISIQAYEQSYGEGPRGRITFNSGQATIDLFQNRNLSTFLHEVGHLWLEELRFDAEMPDAPEQIKADWQQVQDWFASQGHKVENGFIPVEAHEMWARGVERYLMEGKAPNSALKRAFETFRAWLTAIYKVVDALKSPITPEIRGVMDRLIATDEQLQDYAEQQRIAALFKTAADAGMTGAEFAEYQRQTEEARTEANSKLIEKTMRVIRARETKRYKEAEATVREEITADVDARPLFKALRLLKTSPMDEKWIRSEMGEDSLSLLPRRVPPTYKTGGVHPDVIAEQSGFASGKAMVEALMGAEIAHRQAVEGGDQRSMRERTIAGEVDAIMQARYGDPLNDGTIEREALEAVHNEMQGEVIAAEIRVLARRTGRRPTPYAIARDWARNKIRQGVVSVEASPSAIQRYARAAAKAATKAQEAMLAQDVEEAFRQKQAQMVNNALVAEAKAAADEVEKAVKRMEKIAKRKTIKSVDQEYLEQAQALLENVDLRRRSQVGINRQNQFEAWAQEQQAAGHDVPVPPSFEQTLGKTNWTRLSVENLLSLDETIKHIMHLGRLKQTLLDNKERRDFDELVKEATDSAGNLRQRPPSDLMAPSYWDGIKSKILAADAALLKMETVFDWLDGNNPNGVFNRIVFRPIADAQEAERLKLQEYIEKLTDALKAVPKEVLSRWGDKVTTGLLNRETGRPFIFTRDMLVSMALNVGNQSNLDKLAGGYGWNEGEILATLASNLTEAEWQYVQSVWDTIDSLWPEIEAMEKRINGVAPEKIEARPVETPFGTLRGGYFPVVYDPARNYDAEANAAKGRDLFETIYTRATTPKGFTKERTNVERPIHLSLGIINRHVAEVIHDLTHREAIMQADKFLSDKRVMKAVDDTLGPEVRRQFRPWLQRIANEWAYDRAGNAGAEKFLRTLRANATIVGMGFRLSTILMQAAGYSNSFERVGFKWVAKRIKDVANPAAYEFVLSKSAEVAGRMDNLDRDIRDNVKSAMGKTDWLTAPKRFAFHGIAYMDRLVVIPTWLGAYDKAIAEGMADEDAVYAADKAVRQSQGSGAAKDLAAIQSGRGPAGEALKLMTMFYSYMSAFYQRQRSLGRDTRNGSVKDMPALLARAWWLIVVPPVLAELLAGRGPDEDEDEALWAFEKMMLALVGPIPLARDIAPIALARAKDDPTFGYKFTPVSGAGQSLINVVSDVSNVIEGEETKRATRNMIEAAGYFTGLTTGQMAAAAQFLVDVGYGEQDPQDFSDWWEGLNTGKIKEE